MTNESATYCSTTVELLYRPTRWWRKRTRSGTDPIRAVAAFHFEVGV